VAMIGTGYVGLVSGACFADFGHEDVCVAKDPAKIERLERGEIPIFEPGLDALGAADVRDGQLAYALDSAAACRTPDAALFAVGCRLRWMGPRRSGPPTRSLSLSAPRRGVATAMPTCPMSMRPPRRSPA